MLQATGGVTGEKRGQQRECLYLNLSDFAQNPAYSIENERESRRKLTGNKLLALSWTEEPKMNEGQESRLKDTHGHQAGRRESQD